MKLASTLAEVVNSPHGETIGWFLIVIGSTLLAMAIFGAGVAVGRL